MRVLEKLHAGMRYGAVGCEFSLSQQYLLNKVSLSRCTHKTRLSIYKAIDKNMVARGSQQPNPVFVLGTMVQYQLIDCGDLLGHNYCK